MVVSGVAVAAAVQQGADLTYIHSHFLQLAVSSFLVSVLLSSFLYVRSGRAAAEQLALGGSSGEVPMTLLCTLSVVLSGLTCFLYFIRTCGL